jgi:hypothetical protein
MACLVGTAQAGFTETFTFDFVSGGVTPGAGQEAIETYMESQLDQYFNIEVVGATVYPNGSNPLPVLANGGNTDGYIADAEGTDHTFSIWFERQITSVTFDWAAHKDPFKIYFNDAVEPFFTLSSGTASGTGFTIDLLALVDEDENPIPDPIFQLRFSNGGTGAIGIDNLTVTFVPLPASVLLGVVAVGLAGRKLRKFV